MPAIRPEIWRGDGPMLLASASAARRLLLEGAGLPVETEPSGLDERALQRSLGAALPEEVAARLADAKALAVSERRPGRVVIGADQVLGLEGEALGKAADPAGACRQLARLSSRSHELLSGVSIAQDGHVRAAFVERATLTMRLLDEAEIARYVARAGEAATRSAGCYEVEGLGIHLFDRIEGEHSTILGLPLLPLLAALRGMGLTAL